MDNKNKTYEKLTVEISNICNAKCKWCTTGIKNINGHKCKNEYMTKDEFENGINYLISNYIIDRNTEIELYNWGEPLLNPHFEDIIKVVCYNNLHYHISTNASEKIFLPKELLNNLNYWMFSLSGFTKESYSKIHGLDFDKVIKNIRETSDYFKSIGFNNKIVLNYHIYQFNLDEIYLTRNFCTELGINFFPSFAYFNDFKLFNDYLTENLDIKTLYSASKDLFLGIYDKLSNEVPPDYQCPEFEYLVVDSKFNIIPCCRLTSDESLGNLLNYSKDEIFDLKNNVSYCNECIENKQHFIVHNEYLNGYWERFFTNIDKFELDKYKLNLNITLAQNKELRKNLEELDKFRKNLEIAINQREELRRINNGLIDDNISINNELDEFRKNLEIAINQREELRRMNNVIIDGNSLINAELDDFRKNLEIAINQREALVEINIKETEKNEKLINENNLILQMLDVTKNEVVELNEEIDTIKKSKLYRFIKKK